jgi:hypothetical protein
MQPLDVGLFGLLKKAMSLQLQQLIQTGVTHLQKAEWLQRYIHA